MKPQAVTCLSPNDASHVIVYFLYQDTPALSNSLSSWQVLGIYYNPPAFLGSRHGVWIPGCHRLVCCRFLCPENKREDLALREAKHLLGRAACWREGLRGQGCRGMGKRQQDGSHSLIRPGLQRIFEEKSFFDLNWPWDCACTACSQINRFTESLNPA